MRRPICTALAACGLAFVFLAGPPALAGSPPTVYSVVEGRDTEGGRPVLIVIGKKVSKFNAFRLDHLDGSNAGVVTRTSKSRTMIVLALQALLAPGEYDLVLSYGRAGDSQTHRVTVTRKPVPPDLDTPGVVNEPTNPVDWTRLKGVPAGFSDGDDEGAAWTHNQGGVYRSAPPVGIGVSFTRADLGVQGVDGVLFVGTEGAGQIPATGAGTRLMWYPARSALRAGTVTDDHWDQASVGLFSTAFGFNPTASGARSLAVGNAPMASGLASVSLGYLTTASGSYSTALGSDTIASANRATALGEGSIASAYGATAMGVYTEATGERSTAIGDFTIAQAYASAVVGRFNVVEGTVDSWVATEPLLVAGNGSSTSNRSNALALLKNGNMTIAGTLTENSDARLKTDLVPLTNVLARLSQIDAVGYRFRDEGAGPAGRHVGLLAQDVREVFPELVREDASGNLSIAYGKLSAVLLQAVKEQQQRIDEQADALERRERELDAARDRMSAFEQRLRDLENSVRPPERPEPAPR